MMTMYIEAANASHAILNMIKPCNGEIEMVLKERIANNRQVRQ